MISYPIIVFWSDEDNAYIAVVPDLSGCSAGGETEAQAIEEVHIAIELWLEAATAIGNPIPQPRHPKFLKEIV